MLFLSVFEFSLMKVMKEGDRPVPLRRDRQTLVSWHCLPLHLYNPSTVFYLAFLKSGYFIFLRTFYSTLRFNELCTHLLIFLPFALIEI